MVIGIVDYGMGNLRSVQKSLQRVGADAQIVVDPDQLKSCDRLVLPGVGAFGDAMAHLAERHLIEPLKAYMQTGRPFLGICLGLQLLFERSEEEGEHVGLGILPGAIVRFQPTDHALKVPQMGWNTLQFQQPDNPLYGGVPAGSHVYFVHSYYAAPTESGDVATTTDYDGPFCSSIRRGPVFATQFHPEKSQKVGLRILENFIRFV